jgi:TonB family protein
MRRRLLRLALFVVACGALVACGTLAACGAPKNDAATDTRAPIAVEYVRAPEVIIHGRPSDAAPVVTKYQNGEAVDILSRRGDWTEIRMASGSGWVHSADVAPAAATPADDTKPHFRREPAPVTEPGAHGEMVLEASVNSDGQVVAVRVVRNTTGSRSLEAKNINSLQQALFEPMVRHGQRMPFTYEQRVQY